jgi:hypothetical protein
MPTGVFVEQILAAQEPKHSRSAGLVAIGDIRSNEVVAVGAQFVVSESCLGVVPERFDANPPGAAYPIQFASDTERRDLRQWLPIGIARADEIAKHSNAEAAFRDLGEFVDRPFRLDTVEARVGGAISDFTQTGFVCVFVLSVVVLGVVIVGQR